MAIWILLGLIIYLFIYFIPATVGKNKKHSTGILVANIFLGWTFIGWVATLIWACVDPEK